MHVYIHVYIHTCMYVCTYVCTYVSMTVFVYIHEYDFVHTNYLYKSICIYTRRYDVTAAHGLPGASFGSAAHRLASASALRGYRLGFPEESRQKSQSPPRCRKIRGR